MNKFLIYIYCPIISDREKKLKKYKFDSRAWRSETAGKKPEFGGLTFFAIYRTPLLLMNRVLYRNARFKVQHLSHLYAILTEKAPIWYTFYWWKLFLSGQGYSLWWPIRRGSAWMGYLGSASSESHKYWENKVLSSCSLRSKSSL